MFTDVSEHAFPFPRTLGGVDSTDAHHMKDAVFTIPTTALFLPERLTRSRQETSILARQHAVR